MMTLRELRASLDSVPEDYLDLEIFATCNIAVGSPGAYAGYVDLTGGGWIEICHEE